MTKIFFTSDLHFSHRNIAKFCPHTRPQGDVDVLNRYMIEYWNDTVGVDDIVYNLGDVSFSHNLKDVMAVLQQLNGHHHLIFGNHDHIIRANLDKFFTTRKHDGKPVFSSAQDYLKIKLENKTLILFHYPINEWDGCHKGYYHLHGHIHNRMAKVGGKILNVGFDLHARFLSLDDVSALLEPMPRLSHFSDDSPITQLHIPEIFTQTTDYDVIKHDPQIMQNNELIKFLVQQRLHDNQL